MLSCVDLVTCPPEEMWMCAHPLTAPLGPPLGHAGLCMWGPGRAGLRYPLPSQAVAGLLAMGFLVLGSSSRSAVWPAVRCQCEQLHPVVEAGPAHLEPSAATSGFHFFHETVTKHMAPLGTHAGCL